ncbi:hypothetical protein LCGC14_2318100, partial [marine sediment metagenome]
ICDPKKSESAIQLMANSICDYDRGEEPEVEEKDVLVWERMSDIDRLETVWLMPGVIPSGLITMFISQEGAGKSSLAAKIAGNVTSGKPFHTAPDVPREPGSVIVFSAEEDKNRSLKYKYDYPEVDQNRIIRIQTVLHKDEDMEFDVEVHTQLLRDLSENIPNIRLVIFDPITSYVTVNENSNRDVRKSLRPLIDYAAEQNVSVLLLTHLNKKVDLGMINRTIGSRAWSAVPRMIWGIEVEKADDDDGNTRETGRRFLLPVKYNICRRPTGLEFSIGDGAGAGEVVWGDHGVVRDIDGDLSDKSRGQINDNFTKALDWVEVRLLGGAVLSETLFAEAKDFGWSKSTMYNVKTKLNIKATNAGQGSRKWFWELRNGKTDAPF